MSGEELLHQSIPFMLECPVGGEDPIGNTGCDGKVAILEFTFKKTAEISFAVKELSDFAKVRSKFSGESSRENLK